MTTSRHSEGILILLALALSLPSTCLGGLLAVTPLGQVLYLVVAFLQLILAVAVATGLVLDGVVLDGVSDKTPAKK